MKRLFWLLPLLLLLLAPSAQAEDYDAVYAPILARYADRLENGWGSDPVGLGETAIAEVSGYSVQPGLTDEIGYAIRDLSGDGIPELIIAHIDYTDGTNALGQSIYAVYSCAGGEPKLIFEGWARNNYSLLSDGTFLNAGSNGAAYAIWGIWELSQDGSTLDCLDYYFTYERGDDWSDIGFYHNLTGEWDKAASEELEMTDEQFWRLSQDAAKRKVSLSLVPFSKLGTGAKAASFLYGQWVEEMPAWYTEVTADTDEYATRILLSPVGTVTDFSLLALEFVDADDNGNITFNETPVYTASVVNPGKPMVVSLSFIGEIPNYGIRYTDDAGIVHSYSLNMSGMDGSLLLLPF